MGAAGTLVGVALLAGVPALVRMPSLKLRFPHAARFSTMVLAVGAAGGATGHHLFLNVARGSLNRRALVVGAQVGMGTSLIVWTVTTVGQRWLSPFEPGIEARQAVRRSLWPAAVIGPLGGVAVSTLVANHLWEKFGLS